LGFSEGQGPLAEKLTGDLPARPLFLPRLENKDFMVKNH
jgi:hypothetical protein